MYKTSAATPEDKMLLGGWKDITWTLKEIWRNGVDSLAPRS
jgi:hypothetical protein